MHTKAKLRRLGRTQLIMLLYTALMALKSANPRKYRAIEAKAFGSAKRISRHRGKVHGRHKAHRLRAGVHRVNIKGKMRKVRVLANGRWRFMKG